MRKLCLVAVLLLMMLASLPASGATCEPVSGSVAAGGNVVDEMHDAATLKIGAGSAAMSTTVRLVAPITATASGSATRLSLSFTDGENGFVIVADADLTSEPGATIYTLSGTGPLGEGSGSFAGVTGEITIKGTLTVDSASLVGDLTGTLCLE